MNDGPKNISRPPRKRHRRREEGAREEVQGGRRGLRGALGQEKAHEVRERLILAHLNNLLFCSESSPQVCSILVLCLFLKIRNCESRFLLPFSERRNCESKNDSFFIHFTILLANDSGINSRKKAKNNQGIGIAILLESDSTQH